MKSIDYKKVDMTEDEFAYYQDLSSRYSTPQLPAAEYFKGLFEVDDEGFIMLIKPKNNLPFEILFFIQQLMISQRLRIIDKLRKG